ncbi:DUF4013 domain-containing protein [Halorussus halophilus]|uniref:DUF4013 domain-containing protein n=1 Tax=Halorussus halophilus TaxID=2650975 RepID=UPI0013015084|nr:DUF4013 domain-containing protein [Halorussus halophilus]
MLREALTYPTRGEHAERALVVGTSLTVATGILARLGVLALLAVVPAVLLAGYVVAVLRDSGDSLSNSDDGPPPFSDVRRLLTDGLRTLVVSVCALVVPIAVLLATFSGAQAGQATPNFGRTLSVYGAGTVALLLALLALYVLPIALKRVASEGSLRAATDWLAFRRTATDGAYFYRWSVAVVVGGVALTLAFALASLGRLGEVVALALSFYASLVVSRLIGVATG